MWIFTIKFSHYYFHYFRCTFAVLRRCTGHACRAYVLYRILTQFYSLQWWSKPTQIGVFVEVLMVAVVAVRTKPHPILWSSSSSQPFQFIIICLSAANITSPIVRFCFHLFYEIVSLLSALNSRKCRRGHAREGERGGAHWGQCRGNFESTLGSQYWMTEREWACKITNHWQNKRTQCNRYS